MASNALEHKRLHMNRGAGIGYKHAMTSSSVSASEAKETGSSPRVRGLGRSALVYGLRFGALAAFLGVWEAASRSGMVDPLFASSPSLIAAKLVEMLADGSIWPHIS